MSRTVIAAALLLAACAQKPAPFSFDRNLSVATGSCLVSSTAGLPAGTPLRLLNPMQPQTESRAAIIAMDPACRGYRINPPQSDPAPRIAIANYSDAFHRQGEMLTADLDGDGRAEYFRACTSSEGVHLTVWTGRPFSGRLRWHAYHYLGYDVDPDCRPEETPITK